MPPHPSVNSRILRCYPENPRFNDAYSRNHLSKITPRAYVINLNEYKSIGIYLYVNGDNVTYFDSFGVENIPK